MPRYRLFSTNFLAVLAGLVPVFPAEYDNSYLLADHVVGKIFRLESKATGGGYVRTDFVTGMGDSSAISMTLGPYGDTQALYYTSHQNGGDVRRITYVDGAPTAAATATPTSGRSPLQVSFDGSGSSDPDGDALTYLWDFGDGKTATTTTPTTSHTYDDSGGTYTATLRARRHRRRLGADHAPYRGGRQARAANRLSFSKPALPGRAGDHAERQRHRSRGRNLAG